MANLTFDFNTLFSQLFALKTEIVITLIIVYLVTLIGVFFYWKYIRQAQESIPSYLIIATFIGFEMIFLLYISVLYGHHSLVINFFTVFISILVYFNLTQSNFCLLNAIINNHQHVDFKNAQLMNKYFEKIDADHTRLSTRYKEILAFYPDAFFIILDFNICETNTLGIKLLGYTEKKELLGEDLLHFIPSTYHRKLRALIQNLSPDHKNPVNSDFEIITKSGEYIYVEGSFILTDLYDAPSVLVSIRDLSFHKEAYELQKQIEMEKLKVEFFSTISHELRTPVNIIYSASQLQDTLIHNNQIEDLSTYTQMINHNCLRLLRLLNNILDLSRIESNYFTVNSTDFNIVTASESIFESIIPYANRKNITPVFDTDCEEIYCHLDPELFERILLNLLSNAIKYGKEGGTIDVFLESTKEHVHIHIQDNGVGIPPEKLDYIFNRFMRVENGLIRNAEGSGIGLSLVKSLVEKQNGTITVTSTLEKGTQFIVSFPLSANNDYRDDAPVIPLSTNIIELEFSDIFYTES
ncbi:MAG: PAS domain-containing sensor histidine kinase [Cellulosilyticaceae bacterium]